MRYHYRKDGFNDEHIYLMKDIDSLMVVRERPSLRVKNLDPDETKQQVF